MTVHVVAATFLVASTLVWVPGPTIEIESWSNEGILTCSFFVGLGRFELPTFGPPDRSG